MHSKTSLRELSLLFLKLGTIAFGGPAAHIAMMRHEVVERRQWLSEAEFLDYLGATNLIPGPNSTELAIHIGHQQRGFPGLLVAGASFILPAMIIVWAVAWAYVTYGNLPQVASLLYGVKPVVIAIVLQALWGLSRSAIKSLSLSLLAGAALVLTAARVNEVLIIFGIGALSLLLQKKWRGPTGIMAAGACLLSSLMSKAWAATAMMEVTSALLADLFLVFLKIGSVLFGSGYVLVAFLRADLVERLHWITESQLLDAVAVGQFTPGPVFTTATFVGYLVAGNAGAMLATIGIFLPAFFFVAVSAPWIPRLRRSPTAAAFLDGVNVASLALMAYVVWELGRSTLIDPLTFVLAAAAGIALIHYKINSAWLIALGGLIGYLKFI